MAQWLVCPTPDFSSGHDLRVCGVKAMLGSVLTAQSLAPALDSVSPSLSAPHQPMCAHALSQKQTLKNNNNNFLTSQIGKRSKIANKMVFTLEEHSMSSIPVHNTTLNLKQMLQDIYPVLNTP